MTPNEFKSARMELGMTQKELGEAIGMSDRHVRNLETEGNKIKLAYQLAIKSLER